MLNRPSFSREMRVSDIEAVDALLRLAFDGPDEAELVKKLRKAGAIAGETVLPWKDGVGGYYAVSKMVAPKGWLALAPVAIHPDLQRKNHGKRMIGMLSEWARLSNTTIVVLGAVTFYEAAGFDNARAVNLRSAYSAENLLLAGGGDTPPAVDLVYPKAFAGL